MLSKFTGAVGAIAFGGAFIYIGYLLYSGNPIESVSRKGRLFMQAQNWLVETLGMSNAGLLLIAVGVVVGGYFFRSALLDSDDDE